MTPPTEDPAITALNAVLKPLGTKLGHYEAYAREPAIAAMRAVLEATNADGLALARRAYEAGQCGAPFDSIHPITPPSGD